MRLRPRGQGPDPADGEARPRTPDRAALRPRSGCARGRDLPRARAATARGRGMISRLRGSPAGRTPEGLVVDVAGVGYLVAATPSVLRRADGARKVIVETYLHVREDALQLYGFADADERDLFVRLLGVSGIGPKVALAVVSSGPANELRRAITLDDPARFQVIPGIGKKTAERIVLELKGSIADAVEPGRGGASVELVARDALVELGFSVVEAERALATVDAGLPPEERVREALRQAG